MSQNPAAVHNNIPPIQPQMLPVAAAALAPPVVVVVVHRLHFINSLPAFRISIGKMELECQFLAQKLNFSRFSL